MEGSAKVMLSVWQGGSVMSASFRRLGKTPEEYSLVVSGRRNIYDLFQYYDNRNEDVLK